jgi:hypothetical protein
LWFGGWLKVTEVKRNRIRDKVLEETAPLKVRPRTRLVAEMTTKGNETTQAGKQQSSNQSPNVCEKGESYAALLLG